MSLQIDLASLTWQCCTLAELSPLALQNIHRARQAVFVLEQHCAYADADDLDECAHHLSAWTGTQSLPIAYARIVAPGARYTEPAIGRVLTMPHVRTQGLGRELMLQALSKVGQLYPTQAVRISAQAHLQGFYGSLGFEPVGGAYLEDGIPHVEMLRGRGFADVR